MKKLQVLFVIMLMLTLALVLIACDSGEATDPATTTTTTTADSNTTTTTTTTTTTSTSQGKEITGVIFENKTVTYNGSEHKVLVSGTIPDGVNVDYTNNKGTNANTYEATAVLSGEGYITKTLYATLKIEKANYDMSGATWSQADFTYNGNAQSVTVSGLPNGVTVKNYQNNEKTNAGSYTATVSFNYDQANYNAPIMSSCSWEIKKADFSGLTFKNESFDYDGTEKLIEVQGVLPSNTNIIYSCKEDNAIRNTATEIGSYTIVALIKNPNFNDYTLEATLSIKGSEDERFIAMHDGVLYFANALHGDYLYAWDGTNLVRLSSDVPYNLTVKNGELYFRGKSLFGGAVKQINVVSSTTNIDSVADVKGEYLVTDGTYFYYAVNGLTASGSGIYKLSIPDNGEPVITKLSEGKAKYLQYHNGYLYFADGNNGYKLSKISTNGGARVLVRDEKINCLTVSGNYLFYTVNNLVGDYIENYNISNGTYRKLTIDAGANLTVIGNKLYYINVDLLTSYVRGEGIYYVNAFPIVDNQLSGNLLVGDSTYSSLTYLGDNKIAFYRIGATQDLIVYDLDTNSEVNILEGFTPPETKPLSTGSKTASHNGVLYYLDLHNDKFLYSYNPLTGAVRKISANKVSDFAIIGDWLYYNSVSILVNNDLYRVNLKTGGEPEKISTFDANDIVFDGENVFYVEKNASGVRTAIRMVSSDGSDPIVYSKGVDNLRYYNGYLYFIDGDKLYRMPTKNYTVDQPTMLRDGDVDVFEIHNGVIYFREVLLINKNLSKINVDGTGYAKISEKTHDPVDITIYNGEIYFYSDTAKAATAGIFKVNSDGSITQIMPRTVGSDTYYPTEITVIDGKLYFVNYVLGGALGDSHLYCLTLSNGNVEMVK